MAYTNEQKRVIKDALEENGIMLSSFCISTFNQYGLVDSGKVGKEKVLQGFRDIIRSAKDIGAGVILVPFFGNNKIKNDDDQNNVIEGIKAVLPTAEEYKIVLALEMSAPPEMMMDMLDSIDSQCAGIYYDVGNMASEGFDHASAILELGGFISAVHIKDRIINKGGVPLGEGDVNFDAVRDALKDIGYDRMLILETPSGDGPELSARNNLAFVKKIWGL